jgi:flagellar biosynthesis protein FlhF
MASAQLVRAPRAEGAVPAARGARAPAPSFQQRAARERKEPQTDAPRVEPRTTAPADANVERDVQTLGMSTLTFQDYVRERMLKRREQELGRDTEPAARTAAARDDRAAAPRRVEPEFTAPAPRREVPVLREELRVAEPETHPPGPGCAARAHRDAG